jgi:hypothetical protein
MFGSRIRVAAVAAFAVTGLLLVSPALLQSGATQLSSSQTQTSRSELTQKRYRIYTNQLHGYYGSLIAALRLDGQTDLLSFVAPPRDIHSGYQRLPKISPDDTPSEQRPRVVAYSWPWTDKLINDAMEEINQSAAALTRIKEMRPQARRRLYEALAHRYVKFRKQIQNIDAHIQYNRLWQAAITDRRAIYDRETALYSFVREREALRELLNWRSEFAWFHAVQNLPFVENELRKRETVLARKIDAAAAAVDMPEFIRVERRPGLWILHVPFYTDIEDTDFLNLLREKIETVWHLRTRENEFRVRLGFTLISSDRLYSSGEIPRVASKIELDRHLSLFPSDGAILTTGALTTHVSGRAIVLGPQDVSGRLLGHEMGHILGFRDSYVRGYRDLGRDGFQIMEAAVESNDIMAGNDRGVVLPSHFEKLRERLPTNRTAQIGQ